MGKRFTDTAKWGKLWFRKLPPHIKCFWQFILDDCDAVGVWDADFERASFHIGEGVSTIDIEYIGEQIFVMDNDKWWVVDFVEYQYGTLSEACKPHASYIKLLKKHRLYTLYSKGMVTLQEKEKEIEKEKDSENPVESAIRKVFGFKAETGGEIRRVRWLVRDFKTKLADFPDPEYTLRRLVKDHKKKMPNVDLITPESILKHFDALGPHNKPNGKTRATTEARTIPDLTDEQRAAARKTLLETKAELFPRKEPK